jgi:hypothetical protein
MGLGEGLLSPALQGLKPRTFRVIHVGAKAPTHKPKESFEDDFRLGILV